MTICRIAVFGALAAAMMLCAETRRIYIAPDDHTDYMWTADEETYRQAFIEMIDYYLDLADKTRNNPPEHQSRWHCDGCIWYWTYEHNKTPAEFERLIDATRDGHISLPLNALVSTTAAHRPKPCCGACTTPAAGAAVRTEDSVGDRNGEPDSAVRFGRAVGRLGSPLQLEGHLRLPDENQPDRASARMTSTGGKATTAAAF